jgi:hypothetical protein
MFTVPKRVRAIPEQIHTVMYGTENSSGELTDYGVLRTHHGIKGSLQKNSL